MKLRRLIAIVTLALVLLVMGALPAAAFNVLGCYGVSYGLYYSSEYAPEIPPALLEFRCNI
jgi:hypothetical protein